MNNNILRVFNHYQYHDPFLWIGIEIVRDDFLLKFYDLSLPYKDHVFFEVRFSIGEMRAITEPSLILFYNHNHSVKILGDKTNVHITFKPTDWPIESSWTVLRHELTNQIVKALNGY